MRRKVNKGGRPSEFDPAYCEKAEKLCLLGVKDTDLAFYFNVSEQTFNVWKKKHPELVEALKKGKDDADANVGKSLYQRALGYSHPDVHISNYQGDITVTPITKHYPPDPTSCIFWLKNRQRALWRDKQEHEMTGKDGTPLAQPVDDVELARRVALMLRKGIKD